MHWLSLNCCIVRQSLLFAKCHCSFVCFMFSINQHCSTVSNCHNCSKEKKEEDLSRKNMPELNLVDLHSRSSSCAFLYYFSELLPFVGHFVEVPVCPFVLALDLHQCVRTVLELGFHFREVEKSQEGNSDKQGRWWVMTALDKKSFQWHSGMRHNRSFLLSVLQ